MKPNILQMCLQLKKKITKVWRPLQGTRTVKGLMFFENISKNTRNNIL